jgi:Sugar (and other) transporter
MLFNFMTNLGPNAQTYLLAGEVFPTAIRGKGAGFAAAFGKIGAVTTAFLFPILLASIGTTALLYILVVTSILGAVITWSFRIETTGERFCIDWPPSATLFPLNRLLVLAGCLEHERLGTYIRLFPISRILPEDCLLRKIAISASESACSFRLAFLA